MTGVRINPMIFLERYFETKRDELINGLAEYANPRVLQAMREVPRHRFTHPLLWKSAYKNGALPIPSISRFGLFREYSTISQPAVVALMTGLLDPQPDERVLEIGAASGYQAAILGKLSRHVVSVEIIPELAISAGKRIKKLGIKNVDILTADGGIPFVNEGTFDKVLITASIAPHCVGAFLSLLKEGGVLVAPIGGKGGVKYQCDIARVKAVQGSYEVEKRIPGVVFVLLQGQAGWDSAMQGLVYRLHDEFFFENKQK